jgi:hypothetical protein
MFNGFGAHGGAGAVQPPFGQVRSCTDQVQDTKNLPFLSLFSILLLMNYTKLEFCCGLPSVHWKHPLLNLFSDDAGRVNVGSELRRAGGERRHDGASFLWRRRR